MLVAKQQKEAESTSVYGDMATTNNIKATAMVAEAVALKDEGNALFSEGDFGGAKDKYQEALTVLQQQTIVVAKDANALVCKLHSNLGAVAMKQNRAEEAIEHCKLALAIDEKYVKALFRRAESLKMLGRYQEALTYLEKALLLEEDNEEIREAMDECEELIDDVNSNSNSNSKSNESQGATCPAATGMASLSVQSPKEDEFNAKASSCLLPEEVLVAVQRKIDDLRSSIYIEGKKKKGKKKKWPAQRPGQSNEDLSEEEEEEEEEEALVKEHIILNHGEGRVGMIEIKDAFMSPSNISSALAFVRSQHFTATAKYAFIIVQKSKVIYPHIWWAHPWPFPEDMEKDGIFLEVHTNPRYEDRDRDREISSNPEKNASSSTNMKHGTWFIVRFLYFETGSLQPLEGSRDGHLVPQREILLDQECKLLDEDECIFP